MEVTGVTDGAPYQSGADWMVERTTTLLPLCSYFNPVGSYSLKLLFARSRSRRPSA